MNIPQFLKYCDDHYAYYSYVREGLFPGCEMTIMFFDFVLLLDRRNLHATMPNDIVPMDIRTWQNYKVFFTMGPLKV